MRTHGVSECTYSQENLLPPPLAHDIVDTVKHIQCISTTTSRISQKCLAIANRETYVSLTKPTQNKPTRAVTPPASIAAPKAWPGAPNVCATKRYVVSANGNVSVSGATVSRTKGANTQIGHQQISMYMLTNGLTFSLRPPSTSCPSPCRRTTSERPGSPCTMHERIARQARIYQGVLAERRRGRLEICNNEANARNEKECTCRDVDWQTLEEQHKECQKLDDRQ